MVHVVRRGHTWIQPTRMDNVGSLFQEFDAESVPDGPSGFRDIVIRVGVILTRH